MGKDITRQMAQWVRQVDSNAVLFVNDYDILTGVRLEDYMRHIRRDWTPLPAAEAYRDLVFRQWWTRWQGRTDAKGRCEVRAFFGQHRIKAGAKEQIVTLRKSEGSRVVSFN